MSKHRRISRCHVHRLDDYAVLHALFLIRQADNPFREGFCFFRQRYVGRESLPPFPMVSCDLTRILNEMA
jgi:hypothetical protein